MITTRKIRAATAVAATAVLLTLAAAIPATAAPASTGDFPVDHGVFTLKTWDANYAPQLLQETGDIYAFNSDSRNVVVSPEAWNINQQKWRFIEIAPDQFRILSVDSGRALQRTGNVNGFGATNVAATPAWWNSIEQVWIIRDFGDQLSPVYSLRSAATPTFQTGQLVSNFVPYSVSGVSEVQAGRGTASPIMIEWLITKQ